MVEHGLRRFLGAGVLLSLFLFSSCNLLDNVSGSTKSDDTALVSLTVSTGTLSPAFSTNTVQYSVEVAPSVTSIAVEAVPRDDKAAIVSGSGSTTLTSDPQTIAIVVQSESGKHRTYTVSVTHGSPPQDPQLTAIAITNGGFESGTNAVDSHYLPDGWTKGGTWAGGWEWAPAVVTGKRAAWSSYHTGGSTNGFSQSLTSQAQAGTYYLTAWAGGDNDAGLVSRIILGYEQTPGQTVELGHNDLSLPGGSWTKQILKVVVPTGSPAIGKPLWLRLTAVGNATGSGGDSNWWDDVNLNYSTSTSRPADGVTTLGFVDISIDRSDGTGLCDPLTLTPSFDPNVTDYQVQSPPATLGFLRVQGFPTTWTAGLTGSHYRALVPGANLIALTVTSETGDSRTYNFHLNFSRVVVRVLDSQSNRWRFDNVGSWYPGIDVQVTGSNTLGPDLVTALANGTLPDLFGVPGSSDMLAVLDHSKDLRGLMGQGWVDRFDPLAVAAGTRAGVPRVVPLDLVTVTVAFTNDSLLGATPYPSTYDQAKALAQDLNARGKKAFVLGGADRWTLQSPYLSTIVGRLLGPSFLTDVRAKTKHFTDPEFVHVLEVFQQTLTDHVLDPGSLSLSYDQAQESFRNGAAAFLLNGSWGDQVFLEGRGYGVQIPVAEQANYSLHPLPPIAATEAHPGAIAGLWDAGYAANSSVVPGSAQELAVKKVLTYLYSQAQGQIYLETGGCIPTWSSELDVSRAQPLIQKMKTFLEGIETEVCPIVDQIFTGSVANAIDDALYALALGTLTPSAAAQAMQDAWTAAAP